MVINRELLNNRFTSQVLEKYPEYSLTGEVFLLTRNIFLHINCYQNREMTILRMCQSIIIDFVRLNFTRQGEVLLFNFVNPAERQP